MPSWTDFWKFRRRQVEPETLDTILRWLKGNRTQVAESPTGAMIAPEAAYGPPEGQGPDFGGLAAGGVDVLNRLIENARQSGGPPAFAGRTLLDLLGQYQEKVISPAAENLYAFSRLREGEDMESGRRQYREFQEPIFETPGLGPIEAATRNVPIKGAFEAAIDPLNWLLGAPTAKVAPRVAGEAATALKTGAEALAPGARRLAAGEAGALKLPKGKPFFEGMRPEDIWDGLGRAEKARAAKAAGLQTDVVAKPWAKVTPEERIALSQLVPEQALPKPLPGQEVLPEQALPETEPIDLTGRTGAILESPPSQITPELAQEMAQARRGAPPPGGIPPGGGVPPTSQIPPVPKYAININLEKLNTSDDVLNLIRNTAKTEEAAIQAQRRGVVSDKQFMDELASMVNMTPEQLARRAKGRALNAEQLWMARGLLLQQGEEVVTRQAAYRAADTTENLLALHSSLKQYAAIQASVSGATAEAGRALRQFRLIRAALEQKTPLQRAIDALGGKEINEAVAQRLGQIDPTDTVALAKFVRASAKFTTADKVSAYWINSILSGPRTQMRNIISNTFFGFSQFPKMYLRGQVERVIAPLQKRPRAVFPDEALPAAMSYFHGIPSGLRKASFILKNGFGLEDITKLENISHFQFTGKAAPLGLPGRLLVAADAMFKSMAFDAEIAAGATRKALAEKLTGQSRLDRIADLIANPTPDMVDSAQRFSHFTTFTDEPDQVSRAILKLRDVRIGESGPAPLKFIIPFINTPWNLLKRGLEYTPVGFAQAIRTTGPATSEVTAKALMGSGIMAWGASMYAAGNLTGAAPKNAAQRDEFYRLGKQPNSIKVGDHWINYNTFAPLNLPLVIAAAFGDAFTQDGTIPTGDRLASAAAMVGQTIIDMSFFQGLSSLLDAMQDPARYAGSLAENIAAGFLPFSGAQRNVAQAIDPIVRDPEGIMEKLKTGIPGLSQQVLPKLDVFGKPIERSAGSGIAAFLPTGFPQAKADVITKVLNKVGITPGFVGTSLTINNEKVDLTPQQQYRYQVLTGQSMYKALADYLVAAMSRKLTIAELRDDLERIINNSRKDARDQFKDEWSAAQKVTVRR